MVQKPAFDGFYLDLREEGGNMVRIFGRIGKLARHIVQTKDKRGPKTYQTKKQDGCIKREKIPTRRKNGN